MIVNRNIFCLLEQRGASVIEVILSMSIIAISAPFIYNQISKTTENIQDISIAKKIVNTKNNILNFVRVNEDLWPDVVQIQLDDNDLLLISDLAVAGFVDKYTMSGATVTDVYLAFDVGDQELRANNIAKKIGDDAAIVGADGVAYSALWAVSGPDFKPGDLIYRVSRDALGNDKSNYLHRGASGEDDLNVMMRDLNMAGYDLIDVGDIVAESITGKDITTTFVKSSDLYANTVYFSSGANMNGENVEIDSLRALSDINGFREINADVLNDTKYSTTGGIITDRANVTERVNVANNFILKSSGSTTISGFTGINAGYVLTPYLSTSEILFYENSGLTISGELLQSDKTPLKIGSWAFPSTRPPVFKSVSIGRAQLSNTPNINDFDVVTRRDWQQITTKEN